MPQPTRKEKLIQVVWLVLVIVPYVALAIAGTAIPSPVWVVLLVMLISGTIYGYRRGWITSKYTKKDLKSDGERI